MTTHEATAPTLPPQIACGSLPDPSGLLAGVIGSPDDDAPRLVYADWLDEQAQVTPAPRAELIRVQCELARAPLCGGGDVISRGHCAGCARVLHLRGRGRDLSHAVGTAIAAGVGNFGFTFPFARGFLETVRCPWEAWEKHGDALRAKEWVPKVVLATRPDWGAMETRRARKGSPYAWEYRIAGAWVGVPADAPRAGGQTTAERRRRDDERLSLLLANRWPGTTFEFAVGWHVAGLSGTGGRVTAGGRTVTGITAWSMNPVTPAAEELLADSATSLPIDLSAYESVTQQVVGGVAQALGVPPEVATGTPDGATTYAVVAPPWSPLPVDGWHAEFHTDRLPTVDAATGATTGHEDGLRSLRLTLTLPADVAPDVPAGTRLPLVRGTDHGGNVWECRAILEAVAKDFETRTVSYAAVSEGEFRCVEGP